MTHIGNVISSKYNVVAVTAPSLGIPWKLNGKDLRVGGFDCVINSCDLTGSTCTGAEKSQTVIFRANIHFLKQRIVNSGDHKTNCVKDGSSYEFGPCAAGADILDILYIHVEKSPFLLKKSLILV